MRAKYRWGTKELLLSMKVGEVISLPFETWQRYRNMQTNASNINKCIGTAFEFRHFYGSDIFYIKRTA